MEYNITVYSYNMTEFRQALAFGINQSQLVQQAFAAYDQIAYDGDERVRAQSGSVCFNPNIMRYNFDHAESFQLLNSIRIMKGLMPCLIIRTEMPSTGTASDVMATQRWTGWPTDGQFVVYGATVRNPHALVNIMPVISTGQISTQSSQAQIPSGTIGYLIAAAIAIVVIGGITYSSRRRKKIT